MSRLPEMPDDMLPEGMIAVYCCVIVETGGLPGLIILQTQSGSIRLRAVMLSKLEPTRCT